MKFLVSVLLFAWVGAGQALAQEPSAGAPVGADPAEQEQEQAPSAGVSEASAAPEGGEGTEASVAKAEGNEASGEQTSVSGTSADGGVSVAESTGDATLEALNRKLLGDKPDIADAPPSRRMEEMDLPETPGWIWPVGLTLLALLVGLRWQLNRGSEAPSRLQVVQRVMLGRDGNLAVVEVGEEGDRRRLLVGYGGGAPRLVAELDVPDAAGSTPPTGADPSARRWQRALRRALPATGQSSEPSESLQKASEARLRPRTSLIAEVLAERDAPEVTQAAASDQSARPGATAKRPDSTTSPVVEPPEKGEDGDPTDTYTFRGLIG